MFKESFFIVDINVFLNSIQYYLYKNNYQLEWNTLKCKHILGRNVLNSHENVITVYTENVMGLKWASFNEKYHSFWFWEWNVSCACGTWQYSLKQTSSICSQTITDQICHGLDGLRVTYITELPRLTFCLLTVTSKMASEGAYSVGAPKEHYLQFSGQNKSSV